MSCHFSRLYDKPLLPKVSGFEMPYQMRKKVALFRTYFEAGVWSHDFCHIGESKDDILPLSLQPR